VGPARTGEGLTGVSAGASRRYRTVNSLALRRHALELHIVQRQIRGLALEERRLKFAINHSWGLGRAALVLETCCFLSTA